MKICGIEIKGSDAILAIVEKNHEGIVHLPVETKKIPLIDDESSEHVKSFAELMRGFARDNGLKSIAVKKRAKKGEFSGGAVTFKIEGLIQLVEDCSVELLSAPTISAANRKDTFEIPNTLKKYQHEAFLTARAAILRSN
jgi:hypothetical protein